MYPQFPWSLLGPLLAHTHEKKKKRLHFESLAAKASLTKKWKKVLKN